MIIPFVVSSDESTTGLAAKIPVADADGKLDPSWSPLSPPVGGAILYGFIGTPSLPTPPSNIVAIGHDRLEDQLKYWDGSKWITIGKGDVR